MTGQPGVAVVGLGLIGGSICRRLQARADRVQGWDLDPATRSRAAATGLDVVDSLGDLLTPAPQILVVAVPLRAMDTTLAALRDPLDSATTVIDVGSVKAPVRRIITSYGLSRQYVGTHPMAGSERSGFDASTADLLVGAPWVVTVDDDTDPRRLLSVMGWIIDAFAGRVFPLDDRTHDAAVARVSHLPHALATALMATAASDEDAGLAARMAAGSFRDGTRVAGTNPERTEAMITENAAHVAPLLRRVSAMLDGLADDLQNGEDVSTFFAAAARARQRTDGAARTTGRLELDPQDAPAVRRRLLEIGRGGGQFIAMDETRTTAHYRL